MPVYWCSRGINGNECPLLTTNGACRARTCPNRVTDQPAGLQEVEQAEQQDPQPE